MINLKEIDVVAQSPGEWKRRLKAFKREFLGETENAQYTSILNPEVIEFPGSSASDFQAYSDSVIKIENGALGYMLHIHLEKFEYNSNVGVKWICYPRFEELMPSSAEEKKEWEENRKKSYQGSQKHFFLSLINKNLPDESFKVYYGNPSKVSAPKEKSGNKRPAGFMIPDSALVVEPADSDSNTYLFKHETALNKNCFNVIWYGRGLIFNSTIKFNSDYTQIDRFGNFLEHSFSWETYGYWATLRIAHLLPVTYVHKENL